MDLYKYWSILLLVGVKKIPRLRRKTHGRREPIAWKGGKGERGVTARVEINAWGLSNMLYATRG